MRCPCELFGRRSIGGRSSNWQLLQSLSSSGVEAALGGTVRISAVALHLDDDDPPRLNLFFHRPMPNLGWANDRLPSRSGDGAAIANPYLALDLQYLISSYSTKDFFNEVLLGYAMQVLHETPVLPRPLIRDALTSTTLQSTDTSAEFIAALAASDLAEQIEQIKITPHFLSLEEHSQIWSGVKADYRPTAAYRVSVVLIESKKSVRSALPVRGYNIYAEPFNQPRIEDVICQDGPGTPIVITKRVVLRGHSLKADNTRVRLPAVPAEITPADVDIAAQQITIDLPLSAKAGIQAVQVVRYLKMGTPEMLHKGWDSNVAAFILQPLNTKTAGVYDITDLPATATLPRRLQINITPAVAADQRAEVLLNQIQVAPGNPVNQYTLPALDRDPLSAPLNQLIFPITVVAAGHYLVRVRISGAESPLEFVSATGYSKPEILL
jgi:hypothetical protein